jgi:HAD-superfamily hydrolase, subfamily IIIA
LNLTEKINKIKLLLLDVDGVLTDGSIILGESDQEFKIFNIKDGLGIKLAQAAGLEVGIITGRTSAAVQRRAEELEIHILHQGQSDKRTAYEQIRAELGLNADQIAFVGDDLNDLPVLRRVGLSCTVADASEEVKKQVDYISQLPGGKGAVREIIEWILKRQGKWEMVIQKFRAV